MAGRSNKSKNKSRGLNANNSNHSTPETKISDPSLLPKGHTVSSEPSNVHVDGMKESTLPDQCPAVNGQLLDNTQSTEAPSSASKQGEGEQHLYPVSVTSHTGEKLELQLSPTDSVMDIRQFLLDAPETCFFTCYDMILYTKDGAAHHLEDYNEVSEVADITNGGCSIEMVPSSYDDRSIRSHIHRSRDLLSVSNHHASLSTTLGLQHEAAQKKGDAVKPEVPELEDLSFMDDISNSLCNLCQKPPSDIVCIESIVFSSFNPPPSYRRLVGDLIYIDVVTSEGNKLCITGSTKTFYVNSSTGDVLDPKPNKHYPEATTLFGLLQKISPKFKKAFREILDRKASMHPFENVQSLLPPNSWLGMFPVPDHKRDAARAEDALSLSYGTELIGMQRDWNEELQSCREFPHKTSQERILRDRALYKVTCDFVDAAINGAVGVIDRSIQPINPTDPECFHMYVHNNIFFSFAIDADLGQLSKGHAPKSKVNSWKDFKSSGGSQSSDEALNSNGNGDSSTYKSENTNSCESQAGLDVTPDALSDSQMMDSEQATYSSANNDLKGTKAYQDADIPGLYNLAMAIVDYRGHRVVAQSIIPGILQGDKSDSLLYGSVDYGRKIAWNEAFHSKVLEAAKVLHIKEHMVLDGSGNSVRLAAPVECKGIVGSDDRHYILDLMRVTPRDVNYNGSGSRFCVLRPELVASFCQPKASDMLKSGTDGVGNLSPSPVSQDSSNGDAKNAKIEDSVICSKESSATVSESSCKEILLNPNAFTEFKIAGSKEEIAADEASVRKASLYLVDVVLPKFAQDLCSLEVSPMDGQTLTDALHAHGINIRYLGKLASVIKHLPHLWDMCTAEIVVRSAKHILKDVLRESQDHELSSAITHFLNCLFGNILPGNVKGSTGSMQFRTNKKDQGGHQSPRKSLRRSRTGGATRVNQSAYMFLTTESLWSHITEFAKFKYQFELPENSRLQVKNISVIRNLCLKVGLSIIPRKYNLEAAVPFHISDVFNLQPVVKHSVPVCSEARNLIEAGKGRLAEGLLNEAYTLFSEAFSLLQQVTGPMHREVANCCRYLAMVLYHAGDMAGAIMQQHKELIINEHCLGLDHPDTAHSYGNMALFYHGLNQTELALCHMSRTLLLLGLSSGPNHPDVASTFINVAMMFQDIGKMDTALRYLQEALKKNERLLGPEHIQTAVCYHALAIAFNCMGAYKLSLQHEKKTYDIFAMKLGEEDSRTRDSDNWMKTFKMRELQVNAQKQKAESVNAASAQKAIDILKAYPDLLHAFQNAAVGTGNSSTTRLGSGEALLRGRRSDSRAARAAAEVRKKAAARGLPIRSHGIPVQAVPHMAQLVNMMNSNATPETPANTQLNEPKGDVSGNSSLEDSNNVVTQDENRTSDENDYKAPAGLGVGLASLDSKKQKQKPKFSA